MSAERESPWFLIIPGGLMAAMFVYALVFMVQREIDRPADWKEQLRKEHWRNCLIEAGTDRGTRACDARYGFAEADHD